MNSYNLSTILFNCGNKEFENKNYTASLRYYFDSKRTDYYTYYNISAYYYNIGINFYNNDIYQKAIDNFNNCLKYANDFSMRSDAEYYIKQSKAYNLFNYALENFNDEYYDAAINYFSEAKNLFNIESMKNLCTLNIGHSYYNKGNRLYKNANSVLAYKNSIEMYNIAKSYYKNTNDINNCKNMIDACNAYIYQIYAKKKKILIINY